MGSRLKTADALWLMIERAPTPQQVAVLNRYRPPAGARSDDFAYELYEAWRAAPVLRPPFNQRVVRNLLNRLLPAARVEPDPDVDIDYRLRRSALPRPGGERDLAVLISRLHGTPLGQSRPLWEVDVIEGLADAPFRAPARWP